MVYCSWPQIGPKLPNYSYLCLYNYLSHHHHHVPEGLGLFPVPWSSKWSLSLHLFFGRPMSLRPFVLYRNACFGILFLSILCTGCSHLFWYCFISFTMFCATVFFPNTLILFFIQFCKFCKFAMVLYDHSVFEIDVYVPTAQSFV